VERFIDMSRTVREQMEEKRAQYAEVTSRLTACRTQHLELEPKSSSDDTSKGGGKIPTSGNFHHLQNE
jgi:hypothetical protein